MNICPYTEQYNGNKNKCLEAIGDTSKTSSSCCCDNWSLVKHMAGTMDSKQKVMLSLLFYLGALSDFFLLCFQFLVVMSICTNSALLVCLYDQEGKWKIEPGLAAILIMEHVLLLLKFGLSRLVPEEPAWVRATRVKNVTQAQDMYCKQLLRSISGEFASMTKPEQEQQQQDSERF